MRAEARGNGAGFHAELLQGIGEGKWHVHVGHGISGVSTIQQISGAVALAARNGDSRGVPESLAAGVAAVGINRAAEGENQLRGLTVVQRQIIDFLFINDGGDRCFFRLHHAGTGTDFNPFRSRSDLKRDIHLNIVVDDQHEAGLNVVFETGTLHFKTIGPYREVGERVASRTIGYRRMRLLLVGLGHGHLSVDNGRTAGICYCAANLSYRNRLSRQAD